MEFKYYFEEIAPGIETFEIEPNEYLEGFVPHIGGWLTADVQCFAEEDYIPRVKEILESSNPAEEEEFVKNAYKTLVRKDYTTITYIFEEDNPHMVPCTLPTQMLLEILEVWANAVNERSLRKKKEEQE